MSCKGSQDYEECHKNELLSISSIFPGQVREIKSMPLEMEVLVYPAESMPGQKEDTAQVELYVKCPVTYPDSSPFIDLRKSKGLSKQNLILLKSELIKKAKELVGREVIWELIDYSRYFLYEHKECDRGSFYDEMLQQKLQKQKEEADKELKKKQELEMRERQKMLAIEQETLRKREALRDAHKKTRFVDDSRLLSPTRAAAESPIKKNSIQRHRSRSSSSGIEACSETILLKDCKDMLNTKLKFLGKDEFNVVCGRCFKHGERGCVVYRGFDVESGKHVVIIKWTLHFNTSHKLKGEEWEELQKTQGHYIKQIQSIELEFKTIRQVNLNNLVHYLGMSYNSKKDKITIYILQEFISGSSLLRIFQDTPVTIPQLQHYSRQILEALHCLHKNSIVHRCLRLSNIFIDDGGVIRLADYSLDKRLYDLSRMLTKEEEINNYPPTIGKGGQKSDIYRFGVLILTLFAGPLDKESPIILPESLNHTFKDFLNKCFVHDEQERWSAEQLLSHPFLSYQSNIIILPKENEIEDDEMDDDSLETILKDEAKGSRLTTEFDILKTLGKGGFGHVWKVKNKLDSRLYALKRIPVNPHNKQLNRKIKREVKLLSRLNHENIVRYFNSWIEVTPDTRQAVQNGTKSESEETEIMKKFSCSQNSSSIRWDIHDKDFSSYEEDCDDEDDFVVFTNAGDIGDQSFKDVHISSTDESSTPEPQSVTSDELPNKVRQYMYIQMEFCEKSTLRTAIDNGLHKDVSLVWRLFREIVEGLHYIHLQKVIHRDLKPVNIFLDLNDHVKIGDFGLATDVISKATAIEVNHDFESDSQSDACYVSQTGRVGTAFYVAPELAFSGKVHYNQKVDIYSLGIIFFEMCFPPPFTLMERNMILTELRKKDINLPDRTSELLTDEMIQIIKWLLQHDVAKRPSSTELISSKYIPPLLMEESELNNLLENTISNPQSRMYKHMINSLFQQEVTTEFEFTFDIDTYSQSLRNKPSQAFSKVVNALNKVMRLHAAMYFPVPTLMPKSSISYSENCVNLMEHGGNIVMLPRDLRIPFARYVAHSDVQHLKRYSLEKVYRQQKVYGCHPHEQYEFAYDIVTPTPNSFLPDAEIIATVSQIISEFPSLGERKYYIRLNHSMLLAAILIYAEVEDDVASAILYIAGKRKDKTITKALLMDENNVELQKLSERSISRLCQFVELEDNIHKISEALRTVVMHKKSKASVFVEKSLKELDNIILLTEALHVELPIVICPGLVHNSVLFSGMFFHCISMQKSKRKNTSDILAAGGRYDKLIQSFKLKSQESGKSISQSAVGASIAIESIITSECSSGEGQDGIADFLIHSEGSGLSIEKASLMKEIQDLGLRSTVLYDKNLTFDDATDFCRNHGIPHILILSKEEQNVIKMRTLDRERFNERRIFRCDIRDLLPKLCLKASQDAKIEIARSSSLSHSSSSSISVNVRFLPLDKTHNNKKREQYIRTQVMNNLQISSSHIWELIPVDVKMPVIGTIISHCDINSTVDDVQRSFDDIIDEHTKHKRYLSQLCEEICDIKKKNSTSTIVLYSLPDNNFRVIL